MGIGQVLMSMVKEFVYFNSFESLFLILLFLIEVKQKISIGKLVFHVIMLSIVNLIASNIITIPILLQLIYILMMSLYFSLIFGIKYMNSVIINIKTYFAMFIFEMFIALSVMQYIFNINIINFSNDFDKFLFLLPVRVVEMSLIYAYYKFRNRKAIKTI